MEVFLWLAKYFPKKFGADVNTSFRQAAASLRDDKVFMRQAIAFNPHIYLAASDALKKDFDIRLAFLGNDTDPMQCMPKGEIKVLAKAMGSRVDEELKTHETFVKTVLCSMSTQQNGSLAFLDQGNETWLIYKRLVADYLGVPTGKRLRMLRNASKIIAQLKPKKRRAKRKRTSN